MLKDNINYPAVPRHITVEIGHTQTTSVRRRPQAHHCRCSNGHPLNAHDGVCINPYHYNPNNHTALLDVLARELVLLGLTATDATVASILQLRPVVADEGLVFETLCCHLRCTPVLEDRMLMYAGPVDDDAD